MKTTSKKRGFTIVELVIVIAVIAILAAVLIPTFTGVIRRANESKDVQLVRNLNTILAADKATNAHETVDEALAVVAESGFDVGKINASANQNMILWDSVNDVFCYLDDGELVYDTEPKTATADIDLWAISSKVNSTYSTYLTAAYNGNAELITTKGIFVDEDAAVTKVTYETSATQNVVIGTASSSVNLVINAANSNVKHYGPVGNLTVTAVAANSYHENGAVNGTAEVKAGRVVVDAGTIPAIKITGAAVKVETNKDIAVTVAADVDVSAVEIKVTAADVKVTADADLSEKIIAAEGVAAPVKETITKVATADELTAALAAGKSYIVLTADINADVLFNVTASCVIDGDGHTITGKGGARGSSNFTNIAINHEGTAKVAAEIRNLTIVNTCTAKAGRVIETRGNLDALTLVNVKASYGEGASEANGRQILTVGGNQNYAAKITITNCELDAGVSHSYTTIFFNPVDMTITDSTIKGWSTLYFKSPDSSAGSANSKVVVKDSALISTNPCKDGDSNNFACVVIEDNDVNVTIDSCSLTAYEKGAANQYLVSFSNYDDGKNYKAVTTNSKVTITGDTTEAFGNLLAYSYGADQTTNTLVIKGGTYTETEKAEIEACLADNYMVVKSRNEYIVTKK